MGKKSVSVEPRCCLQCRQDSRLERGGAMVGVFQDMADARETHKVPSFHASIVSSVVREAQEAAAAQRPNQAKPRRRHRLLMMVLPSPSPG